MGNNSWTHPPFFSRHLVPQNVGNIIFVCYFLNIGLGSKQINVLSTSPRNQFRDYHTWHRIEKLMPQLWNFLPHTLKTLQTTANLFSNLDFLPKSEFPKTLDFPWIFQRFPMDFPPHGFSGRPRERPTKNVGGCGGGGSPPHESLDRAL